MNTMNPFWIYLWGISSNVGGVLVGACFIFGILTVLSFVLSIVDEVSSEDQAEWRKRIKKFGWTFVSVVTLAMLFPSQQTIALMYILPQVAKSDVIKRDLPQLYDGAIEKLGEIMQLKTAESKK